MPNQQELAVRAEALKERALREARQEVRGLLANAQSFHAMELPEQKQIYTDLVKNKSQERFEQLAKQHGLATAMDVKKASDLIDDTRHENKRIEQAGELAGDFIDSVDFPQFVGDLLEGVFQANLNVTITQMQEYINLMKAATASISKFVNQIDNTAAFGYLAENNSDEFSIDFPPEEGKNPDGSPKAVLTDKEGNKLDLGDNEIKAKIMDAKIAMAREQRALLRETILMGVTRLVVEEGRVKAKAVFDIKATEKIAKADRAAHKEVTTSGSASGGGFFGFFRSGSSSSTKKASISVSSAKSIADTSMAASITGEVDIKFKSDYFKLDNFAEMYAPATQQSAAGTSGQGQLPPART